MYGGRRSGIRHGSGGSLGMAWRGVIINNINSANWHQRNINGSNIGMAAAYQCIKKAAI